MKRKIIDIRPEARLISYSGGGELGPEELVAFGARSTIKKKDPYQLYREAKAEGRLRETIDRVLSVTIGSGHIDVLDQAYFTFIFTNIPRLTTLFLVSPTYLSHLQQSMRYVEPYGIYLPEEIKGEKEVIREMENTMKLYYTMAENGVPKEDARFILPLYTVTNIITVGNARELTHLLLMAKEDGVPKITRELIEKAIAEAGRKAPNLFLDRGPNYNKLRYYPAPNLFTKTNNHIKNIIRRLRPDPVRMLSYTEPFEIDEDELKDALKKDDERYFGLLKNIGYTFIVKMSIATYHQAVRQRTWNHYVESIYDSLERLEYIIPPTVGLSPYRDKYIEQVERLYKLYRGLIDRGYKEEDAIGVVSHAHVIHDVIRIDGWNYIGALPLRRCLRAQWEIRKIVTEISKYVSNKNPVLGKYSLPSCRVFGTCDEKRPCEHIDLLLSKKPLIS
jgi:thymidylate synthase (FAD)